MIATALVLAALGAAPIKLAAPGFTAVNVSEKEAEFYSDYFAQQLMQRGGVKVTTKSEIATQIGLERQKQLLGCAEEGESCIAEIAGALGTQGVIAGSVARLGGALAVTLKVILTKNSQEVTSQSGKFSGEPEVLAWLQEVADDVSLALTGRTPPGKFRRTASLTAIAGGVALGLGGLAYGWAWNDYNRINSGDPTIANETQLRSMASRGRVLAPVGIGLAGVGAAALLAAGGIWLFGEGQARGAVAVAVTVTPSGALVVRGEF